MTDPTAPEPGFPTAGRKPPPADDEPTVVQPPARLSPFAGTPQVAPPADSEETIAQDAQPTTELTRPAAEPSGPAGEDLDGPTRRLWDGDESSIRVTPDTAPPVREKDGEEEAAAAPQPSTKVAPWRRLSSAGALIWVLLALFGFTLVVQLRSNDGDHGLATARQEDLVRILSDLESQDSRLQAEITALETSQRTLTSGVAGRQAALAEAEKRADELGLLAGTLPGRGPGLMITVTKVKASAILNAVQELRGAGGEVMQLAGSNGQTVRIVASSYFVDAEGGGIIVDGVQLTGPYQLAVIGSPQTMQTALQIPGGVVASVNSGGGSVTMEQRATVEVTAVRKATTLQYARPVS
jgi:uncharacterized protein YlxW (UPF0749 family)